MYGLCCAGFHVNGVFIWYRAKWKHGTTIWRVTYTCWSYTGRAKFFKAQLANPWHWHLSSSCPIVLTYHRLQISSFFLSVPFLLLCSYFIFNQFLHAPFHFVSALGNRIILSCIISTSRMNVYSFPTLCLPMARVSKLCGKMLHINTSVICFL